MRRLLDGKIYNTDTATLVEQWDNGKYANDIFYSYENLYLSPKGQWFMTGDGEFLRDVINDPETSQDMALITKEQIMRWCEYRSIDPSVSIQEHFELEEG